MDLNEKKTYTGKDVNAFVALIKANYEQTLADQRELILQLKEEVKSKTDELDKLGAQKEIISKAITEAIKKADDLETVARIKYNQELARIKAFHDKWQAYYNRIVEKYPLDDELIQTSRLNDNLGKVLADIDLQSQFEQEARRLEQSAALDNAKSENITETEQAKSGFTFQEALNPKDDLKSILNDLGLMLDDQT